MAISEIMIAHMFGFGELALVDLGERPGSGVVVPQSGLYTLTLWLREDGLRVDRLLLTTETSRDSTTLQPHYNGLSNRVAQTVGLSTTYFALDVQGLPEVIYTGAGHAYLHLLGVFMAENAAGGAALLAS